MGLENQALSFFVRDSDTGGVKEAKKRESSALIPPEKLQDLLMKIKEEEVKTARVRFQRKPISESQPQIFPTTDLQNILVKITEEEKRDVFQTEQDWLTESEKNQKKRKSEEELVDGPPLVIAETFPMPTEADEKPKERPKVWDHYEKDPNDQNKSVCRHCQGVFDYVYEGVPKLTKGLLIHLSIKHHLFPDDRQRQFTCSECGKTYRRKRTQTQCESRHRQEFKLVCPECGKGFMAKVHYEAHFQTHTDYKPFKCPSCGKRFRNKTHLNQHLRVHLGETPLECQKCHKKFRFYSQRKHHQCNFASSQTQAINNL